MEPSEQRIKIAVQKTGRLTDHSIDLLERCGLKITKSKDQLICYGENARRRHSGACQ
jgi:ATP phosphoribosyltransferase